MPSIHREAHTLHLVCQAHERSLEFIPFIGGGDQTSSRHDQADSRCANRGHAGC